MNDLGGSSIFASGFPTSKPYATPSQKCAVQENGKLRFVVDIPMSPDDVHGSPSHLEEWIVKEVRKTAEGGQWLEAKEKAGGWRKVIVVRGGRTVNFVR